MVLVLSYWTERVCVPGVLIFGLLQKNAPSVLSHCNGALRSLNAHDMFVDCGVENPSTHTTVPPDTGPLVGKVVHLPSPPS
eukprot:39770-Hanusia_phi.AAC.1